MSVTAACREPAAADRRGPLALLLLFLAVLCSGSTILAGNQHLDSGQLQGVFSGSSNSFISSHADYFAGTSQFESSGNTAIYNGIDHYGLMQMSSGNISKYANGMDPTTFTQQSPQFQEETYSKYFGATMNDSSNKQLQSMMNNGQCLQTSNGCQTVTPGFIIGCSQLGDKHCQQQINSGCGTSGSDAYGTTLCGQAAAADKRAGTSGSKNTNSTNSANSSNSTNSTQSTPSNPTRSNPCTCPGNMQGTEAELMKESCPTNTSGFQNWPHTGVGYIGAPVPKVTKGTDICDPSAPSRVPNSSDAAPMSTPVTSANSTNSTNSANSTTPTGSGTGGPGANGSSVANLDKANSLVANGQCGSNGNKGCECVALVQATSNVGNTSTWSPGSGVQGNTGLQQGTVIATFNSNGDYTNTSGESHAAIYMGQNSQGIQVIDQWNAQGYAAPRTIPWNTGTAEAGSNFKVVTH